MAKESIEFTANEKDLLVKLLGQKVKKLVKLAEKSEEGGDKHVAAAAHKQKAEVDALLNKIL